VHERVQDRTLQLATLAQKGSPTLRAVFSSAHNAMRADMLEQKFVEPRSTELSQP
jgi:hypothetical protein